MQPSPPRRPGAAPSAHRHPAGARGALLLAAALLLGGCSGAARLSAGSDYQLRKSSSEALVLVSFTAPFRQLHWSYRSVDGRQPAVEGFLMTSWAVDGEPLVVDGAEVFPFTLPPGEYEFYRWSQPAQGTYASSEAPFSLRFSVRPDQVTYIGNVQLRTEGKRFGVAFVDKREWDVPGFLARYPRVTSDQVVVRLCERVEPPASEVR